MDLGLREILILVGLLVIGGILFDGYRRMRRAKMGSLHLGNEIGGSADDDWEYYKGELPNGGARKVRFGAGPDDYVEDEPERVEPQISEPFGSALDEPDPAVGEPVLDEPATAAEPELDDSRARLRQQGTDAHDQSDLFSDDEILLAARAEQQAKLNKATRGRGRVTSQQERARAEHDDEAELPPPDFGEVLVINVMAREEEIAGSDLLRVLLSCGFRHGDMNIFHRYEQHSGKGSKLFSVANVVEPGTFDPDTMDQMTTPGVCLFMKLPGPKRPMHAFDIMMDCTRKIATMLDADIKDEHHNLLRQQTAEHYRQRVLDFERKYMMYQAGQRQH